jgi:glycosyltransferase involved in cell wall biosynthesis
MISIVIPVHNAACTLSECLQAIRGSDYADYEIIVVDDASTDTSAELATRYGCRVVRLPENVGSARAKNVGASEAKGDILLFTDGDILLQPDTLRLVAESLQDPTVAGVVGLLGTELKYDDFSSQFKNLWMHYTYKRIAASQAAERGVGLFFTSIASIRKDVFERLGGFDTNYEGASVTEDIEFGQRLLSAGCKVRLDGRLTVEHLKHYSLIGLLRTDLERAFGLTKTWLRKRLAPRQQVTQQKYYASVPWFFIAGVPLAWLLAALVVLALWMRQPFGACGVATASRALCGVATASRALCGVATASRVLCGSAMLTYVAVLLVNAPFLSDLFRARGWLFGLQSCLFLPVDLWVSGLGAFWAMIDYLRGHRY